jgi:glycosyltransferase involved in cell wall biosynthesis
MYNNHQNIKLYPIKSPSGFISLSKAFTFGKSNIIDKKIVSIFNELKPDVVHHHNIAGFGPSIFNYTGLKTFYTAHDYWIICPIVNLMKRNSTICDKPHFCSICCLLNRRPPQIWRYIKNINSILDNIDYIISPSIFIKNKFIESGIEKNIEVIPNFIPKIINNINKSYDFSYFLFVGVIERHKGVLELVKSFINYEGEKNVKLLLVGEGSLKEKIQNLITKNNCSEKIQLLGRINDKELVSLYKGSLAVVIPSIWPENNPYVALEALLHGAPILVSNMGGLPEIAKNGDMPIFNNFIELKSYLKLIEDNKIEYKKPKEIYEKHYSPKSYLSKYFNLINDY